MGYTARRIRRIPHQGNRRKSWVVASNATERGLSGSQLSWPAGCQSSWSKNLGQRPNACATGGEVESAVQYAGASDVSQAK